MGKNATLEMSTRIDKENEKYWNYLPCWDKLPKIDCGKAQKVEVKPVEKVYL